MSSRDRHGVKRLPSKPTAEERLEVALEKLAEQKPKVDRRAAFRKRRKKAVDPPECPPYLSPESYEALLELRRKL